MVRNAGEIGECAYIVHSGRVLLRQKGRAVEIISPGEMFGLAALVDPSPRLTTAVSVGRVQLLPIDRELFQVMIRDDEDFALAVMRLLARRLRATAEMFEDCVAELPVVAARSSAIATI